MKKFAFALVGAASLALAGCGGQGDDALGENVQENMETPGRQPRCAGRQRRRRAEAEALGNQADAAAQRRRRAEEAIDDADVNAANQAEADEPSTACSFRALLEFKAAGRPCTGAGGLFLLPAAGLGAGAMSDEPIPAATLVVVRDRRRRPARAADGRARQRHGLRRRRAGLSRRADRRGRPRSGRAAWPCRRRAPGSRRSARRIEETAVAVGVEPLPSVDDALAMQSALVDDRPFAELLDDAGLGLDLAALTPLARWLPNFHVTRRFDTLFFIARAPARRLAAERHRRRMQRRLLADRGRRAGARAQRRCAADLPDPPQPRAARPARQLRRDARRRRRPIRSSRSRRGSRNLTGRSSSPSPIDLGYPVTREKLDGLWRG